MGEPEDLWLLASDAGYGFTVRLKELITDRRAGKTVLNVPENAHVLPPASVPSAGLAAWSSSAARASCWPSRSSDVPEMPRGKGNKLYDIPGKKAARARGADDRASPWCRPRAASSCGRASKQKTLEWRELQGLSRRAGAARRGVAARLARKIDRVEARAAAAPA